MELLNVISKTVNGMGDKIALALTSTWGWVLSVPTFVISLFSSDAIFLTKIIWVALAFDFVFGTCTAVKTKRHILSQAVIVTAVKYSAYSALFWLVVFAEKGIGDTWLIASRSVFAFCMVAEIWSIIGHIAIINPSLIFVRLIRKFISGEVARKLNVSEEEALEVLDGKDKKDTVTCKHNKRKCEENE